MLLPVMFNISNKKTMLNIVNTFSFFPKSHFKQHIMCKFKIIKMNDHINAFVLKSNQPKSSGYDLVWGVKENWLDSIKREPTKLVSRKRSIKCDWILLFNRKFVVWRNLWKTIYMYHQIQYIIYSGPYNYFGCSFVPYVIMSLAIHVV